MFSRKVIVYIAILVTYLIPNNLVLAAAAADSSDGQAAQSSEQKWRIVLANGSVIFIDESYMLVLANASQVIGGMIRIENDIDQSDPLT